MHTDDSLKFDKVCPYTITNFNVEDLDKYKRAISIFEKRYPEYKDVLCISDDPNHITDIRGLVLNHVYMYRALRRTKPEPVSLHEFWKIYDSQ